MVVAEGSRDVGVHVAELAAVTFVEDEDDVPGVDGVPAVALDEGRELWMVVTMMGVDGSLICWASWRVDWLAETVPSAKALYSRMV